MKEPTLGLFTFTSGNFISPVQAGARQAAKDLNCRLVIYSKLSAKGEDLEITADWLRKYSPINEGNVQGMIFAYPQPDVIEFCQHLQEKKYPVVLISRKGQGLTSIHPDNRIGIRLAVDHLASLGHRRIAFVKGPEGNPEAEERYQGYLDGLRGNGIEPDPELAVPGDFHNVVSRISVEGLIERKVQFTALVGANDLSAMTAIKVLQSAGRKVPEDVAVVGFDNISEARFFNPPLTTLTLPSFDMGYHAVERLLAKMKGEMSDGEILLPSVLVKRKSCGWELRGTPGGRDVSSGKQEEGLEEEFYRIIGPAISEQISMEIRSVSERFLSLAAEPEALTSVFQQFHSRLVHHGFQRQNGDQLITVLRRHLLPLVSQADRSRLEDTLHELRSFMIREVVQVQIESEARNSMFMKAMRFYFGMLVRGVNGYEGVLQFFHSFVTNQRIPWISMVLYELDDGLEHSKVSVHQWSLKREREEVMLESRAMVRNAFSFDPFWEGKSSGEPLIILSLASQDLEMGLLVLDYRDGVDPLFEEMARQMAKIMRILHLCDGLQKVSSELARSNQDLQHFAYIASHDLQEPLRMVKGYTQLLARRYKGQLGPDADEFISYAVDGATRMQTLINDLLNYSRVDSQGEVFEPVDSQSAVSQAVSNLSWFMEENKAEVTHDPLPVVRADKHQMVQLFQNLIGNGIKYHGKEPPRIHISVVQENSNWLFSVKDNGIGIEPQYFEKIFQIFQRLHTREQYAGTGIGLAICKKIVERHGGRLWVKSGVGTGSTFFFTLPMHGPGRFE